MSIKSVVEHNYGSWEVFLSNNHYFANDMGFIFRGHGCASWKLNTTLDRLFERINPEGIDLDSTYDFLLAEFVKSIRGRSGISKDIFENKEELWALGQHYGLATPLLDWTHSIYVALFFAFEDPAPSKSGYRTIWAFHTCKFVKNKMESFNNDKEFKDLFKLIDPISDENPRLITQSGLFTKLPLNFDFVNWVSSELPDDAPYLIKINVPESERANILKHLRLMNIHPATLFPEVDGAAKFCNQTLELLTEKHKSNKKDQENNVEVLLAKLANKPLKKDP